MYVMISDVLMAGIRLPANCSAKGNARPCISREHVAFMLRGAADTV